MLKLFSLPLFLIGVAGAQGVFPANALALEPVVEIIAHRGASHDAPENTMSAFRLGWEQLADGVELDVYLSKDGQIVCCHDRNLKRTTGVDKNVETLTADELQKLDAGKWKNAEFAGEKLPLLSEVLAIVPKGCKLFIEVKCGPEIVPELKRVIASAKLEESQTAIISFSIDVCAASKKTMPHLKTYWIVGLKRDPKTMAWNHTADELISAATKHKLDGLNVQACDLVDIRFSEQVKKTGLELYVWTVNNPKLAQQMIAAGVNGITTDRPLWLREQLVKPN